MPNSTVSALDTVFTNQQTIGSIVSNSKGHQKVFRLSEIICFHLICSSCSCVLFEWAVGLTFKMPFHPSNWCGLNPRKSFVFLIVLSPSGLFCTSRSVWKWSTLSRIYSSRLQLKDLLLLSLKGTGSSKLALFCFRDDWTYDYNDTKRKCSTSHILWLNYSLHTALLFFPHREDGSTSLSACRIHGHLYVNKVAGNFHITVGKYVSTWL